MIKNPFIITKYVSDEYFCDRKNETDRLIHNIENGRNVALISPRRMGKSGLIAHLFNQPSIVDNYNCFFVDIYATSTLAELVYCFGKAVFDQLKPVRTKWWDRFTSIIASLNVGMKIDALTGEPTFSMGVGEIVAPEITLDEIFRYLESSEKPCIVAIDEFQQISNYPEKNIEALLRTKIQNCRNTSFVFAGSKKHMMSNMFTSPAKPFYQSAMTMELTALPLDIYKNFAISMFEKHRKTVKPEVVETVYGMFDGCTWFVQMMMNELFSATDPGETCSEEKLGNAFEAVIGNQEMAFVETLARLSVKQRQLLRGIAKEGVVKNITSAGFVNKHRLTSASSVQAALKPLVENEIVTSDNGSYRIYNYFFSHWLKNK